MFDDGLVARAPRDRHHATVVIRYVGCGQVRYEGLGRWVGNVDGQWRREIAGNTKLVNALHPIAPRLAGLNRHVNGAVGKGAGVIRLQVHGLAGR